MLECKNFIKESEEEQRCVKSLYYSSNPKSNDLDYQQKNYNNIRNQELFYSLYQDEIESDYYDDNYSLYDFLYYKTTSN